MDTEFIQEVGYFRFFTKFTLRQVSKRILRMDNRIRLPNGHYMTLPKNSACGSAIYISRCNLDWGSEAVLMQYLEPQKVFLDVGSNIGYYALLASPYVQQVYAFEPDPRNIPLLKNNTDRFDNIKIVQKGVYSQTGKMQFELAKRSEVSHLMTERSIASSTAIDVEVTTIDSFLADRESLPVTAIKTDAEGADFAALVGAQQTIERDQPLILSELWGVSEELAAYAKELNYSIFAFGKPKALQRRKSVNLFQFIEVTSSNNHDFHWKMLFLVPQRLRSSFIQRTRL